MGAMKMKGAMREHNEGNKCVWILQERFFSVSESRSKNQAKAERNLFQVKRTCENAPRQEITW